MLPRRQRISVPMFKKLGMGKTIHTSFFSVRKSPISGPESRFAIVVSSKIAKSAVKRNLVRRRLYSAIRSHLGKFPRPFAYQFFIKKEGIGASFQELEEMLLQVTF